MKVYVTKPDDPTFVGEVDVKSINGKRVVFSDGNTLPCHGTLTDFWASKEDAEGASRFARKAIGHVLESLRNNIGKIERETFAI